MVPSCAPLESRELLTLSTALTPLLVSVPFGVQYCRYAHPLPVLRGPLIPQLPAMPTLSVSTVPASGDLNPYGVAFVPTSAWFSLGGMLHPGDVLVSNFNNSTNVQGTGTTVVKVSPNGQRSLFYNSPEPGLSLALGVLSSGFVLVGNAPTPDATLAHMGKGSLQVVDRFGRRVLNITDPNLIQAPWGLAINDRGAFAQVFVTNALNGTVTRIDLRINPWLDRVQVVGMTRIASGYTVTPSQAAVVLAPSGLAYDPHTDALYVASAGDNAVYSIAHASISRGGSGKGALVYSDPAHFNGPIGMALAPNGDLLTTNGDAFTDTPPATIPPSALVEFTRGGRFVAIRSLDPNLGAAFGVAVRTEPGRVALATVNDSLNNLNEWTILEPPRRFWW